MTHTTLLVHLEPGLLNAESLKITGDLPACFQSDLIEIPAFLGTRITCGEGYVFWDVITQQRNEIRDNPKSIERMFRQVLRSRAATFEWRSEVMCTSIFDSLARAARCADLVITSIASNKLSVAPTNDPSVSLWRTKKPSMKKSLSADPVF